MRSTTCTCRRPCWRRWSGRSRSLAEATAGADLVAVVGAPIRSGDALFNCAVVMGGGEVLGVVPKTYLPNYREYYEKRWFAPATARTEDVVGLNGETVDFAPGLIFEAANRPGFVFAVEICEDYWAPLPPSTRAALAGARILLNLSASNIVIGKADERAMLSASHSARTLSAYVFAASGWGESTTDLAWDGQATVHELGSKLAEGERFALDSHLTLADVDVDRIGLDRLRNGTFSECARNEGEAATVVPFLAREDHEASELIRPLDRFPFVPDDAGRLDQDCYEAFNIQVQGLMRRMTATGARSLVIGVSGGLDSTQALLVACRAFDRLDLPRTGILAYTMPGFATSDGTKSNAWALMTALGVTGAEIDIRPAAEQMFKDIGHPYAQGRPVHDITFENVQAGLRTDYLFRLANQNKAFVLGTGDLSELALGWATYGVGDHMSHYNVNGGVAKTLIRHLIRWVAAGDLIGGEARETLHAILDTEISPELVPAKDGVIQSTEGTVGPLCAERLLPVLPQPVRHGAVQGRLPGAPGLGRRGRGRMAGEYAGGREGRIRPGHHQGLAAEVPDPLLPDGPVQALGPAEWAQGRDRRVAVAARRLAGAVGWFGAGVAG